VKPLDEQEFSNILIIKPSSLGDVVRCLCILHGLRRRYRAARISWLVRPDYAALLKNHPQLDETICFDRRRYGKIARNLSVAGEFLGFITHLRKERFDLVLDLQGLFRSGFFSFCTAAPVRVGFAGAREFAPCFYTHRIAIPEPEHVVDSYWRFAEKLGFGDLEKDFTFPIDTAAAQTAQNLLSRAHITANRPCAALLIGGTEQAKHWPPSQFAALAQALKKRYHIGTVLLGAGTAEQKAARQIVARADTEIIDLVGQTDLLAAAAIIKNAGIVVGNDSGLLHIAAALSVPLVGLYGPTDPAIVGPYGQSDGVVQAGVQQRQKKRYSREPGHQMENIALEDVLETITRKLGR